MHCCSATAVVQIQKARPWPGHADACMVLQRALALHAVINSQHTHCANLQWCCAILVAACHTHKVPCMQMRRGQDIKFDENKQHVPLWRRWVFRAVIVPVTLCALCNAAASYLLVRRRDVVSAFSTCSELAHVPIAGRPQSA